ncbi:MAG: TIGR02300 family protein [Proteobacteria bacterium]|nr:TIGR02300 family protein [Pseudomonadota bacterium]
MRPHFPLTFDVQEDTPVVNPELGTKRTCPHCAARFYDLLKNPITCPKCGTAFIAQAILPSKGDLPGMAAPVAKPREKEEQEDTENAEVELVSLEDVEEGGKDDDETAGIEDVDLGEDSESSDEEEDDTFLVEEEEEGGSMNDLIEGGGKEDEEET